MMTELFYLLSQLVSKANLDRKVINTLAVTMYQCKTQSMQKWQVPHVRSVTAKEQSKNLHSDQA